MTLDLPWNLDGISDDAHRTDGAFDAAGHSLPSEVVPAEFVRDGVTFRTGPRKTGAANLMRCEGQTIELPKTDLRHLHLLVCAIGEKRAVAFGDRTVTVPDGTAFFGQWDSRIAGAEIVHDPADLTAAYVNELPHRLGRHPPARRGGQERALRLHAFLPGERARRQGHA